MHVIIRSIHFRYYFIVSHFIFVIGSIPMLIVDLICKRIFNQILIDIDMDIDIYICIYIYLYIYIYIYIYNIVNKLIKKTKKTNNIFKVKINISATAFIYIYWKQ